MKRAALLVFVMPLGACSDPAGNDLGSGVCNIGTLRNPGPSCTVPDVKMTIDGDASDFAQPEVADAWQTYWDHCEPDTCELIWALDGDSIVFNGKRKEAPSDNLDFAIQFSDPYDLPDMNEQSVVHVSFGPYTPRAFIGKYELFNVPIEFAYTAGGWEVRIPRAIIPYYGAAVVDRVDYAKTATTDWKATHVEPYFPICWEPTYAADPCSGTGYALEDY